MLWSFFPPHTEVSSIALLPEQEAQDLFGCASQHWYLRAMQVSFLMTKQEWFPMAFNYVALCSVLLYASLECSTLIASLKGACFILKGKNHREKTREGSYEDLNKWCSDYTSFPHQM